MNCWQVVKKKFNCNFAEALKIVARDFGILGNASTLTTSFQQQLLKLDKEATKQTQIQFSPEPWNKWNEKFFRRGDITREELEKAGDVFPIKDLYINKSLIPNPHKHWRYGYLVNCKIGTKWEKRVKIYSPQDRTMKFLSSVPLNCLGNLNTLPELDNKLIITKSKKDWLVLSRYFTDCVWMMNESEQALPESEMLEFKKKYERIIVFIGSDPHAVEVCKKITKKYNIEYFNTQKSDYEKYEIEDPFDICCVFGRKELEAQLKTKNLI